MGLKSSIVGWVLFVAGTGMVMGQEKTWQDKYSREEFVSPAGARLLYRQMVPDHIESGKTYPLVLFLHGAGERGDNNDSQLIHGMQDFASESHRKDYPAFVIAPQCPKNKMWVEVAWSAEKHSLPDKASEPLQLCRELIDKLKHEFPIDEKRIYVTGLSMGGFGAFDAAIRWPELFAAAAPICGGGDDSPSVIAKLKDMPMWIAHGADDNVVSPERSRKMVKALEAAGSHPHFVEMKGVGHNCWAATYSDEEFFKWLFAQKRIEK